MPSLLTVVVALSVIGPSKPSMVMLLDQLPFGSLAISASTAARLLEQMCSLSVVEVVELELVHHLDQARAADVVAGGERVDVADRVDRQARVGADHGDQCLVDLALLEQLQEGNVEPLHEHVGAVRAEADAADVHQVRGAGEQADQLALVEAGRGDDEVVEVARAHPGIVGDVGVARLHVLQAEVADEVLDGLGHRVDVAGRAGDGLRQHAALPVEDAGREVAGLAHDGREGGAQQRLRLLLDHGDQPVPHDLQFDVADRPGHGRLLSSHRTRAVSTRAPPASTPRSKLGDT